MAARAISQARFLLRHYVGLLLLGAQTIAIRGPLRQVITQMGKLSRRSGNGRILGV